MSTILNIWARTLELTVDVLQDLADQLDRHGL